MIRRTRAEIRAKIKEIERDEKFEQPFYDIRTSQRTEHKVSTNECRRNQIELLEWVLCEQSAKVQEINITTEIT